MPDIENKNNNNKWLKTKTKNATSDLIKKSLINIYYRYKNFKIINKL